jgi:parallel beta-helix repeat protein
VLNCIISYAGQGGINFNNGDYTYALHNTLFQNAAAPNLNNYAQGSGLASVIPQDINVIVGGAVGIVTISTAGVMSVSSVTTGQFAINQTIQGNNSNIPAGETITGGSGSTWTVSPAPTTAVTATTVSASSPTPYVATADDKVNPNPLIGSFMNGTAWFHQVYSWNDGYNNWINTCNSGGTGCVTSGVTDGNFIILDTFGTSNGNNINYPDQTLVSYNLTYNNGGGGIHIYSSEYITVANNTSYNEHLGPYSEGASANTAALDSQSGFGDTFINNIGVGVPTNPGTNCNFSNPPALPTGWNTALAGGTTAGSPADVFTTNVLALEGAYNSCWNGVSPSGTIEPDGSIVMYPNNYAGFSAAANKHADPLWVSVGVGVGGTGTQSTPPGSANFALQPASPAIGYGVTETYLPPYSTDAGACHHLLSICP